MIIKNMKRVAFTAGILASSVLCAAPNANGAVTSNGASAQKGADSDQVAKIQGIVRDYLLSHPDVVVQSIKNYQMQERQKQMAQSVEAVRKNANALFNSPKVPMAGNPKGEVTLVEFYDFRCPHCREASKTVDTLMKQNPNLKVYYRDFPIFGGQSNQAAKASIAAYSLNPAHYLAFHDALMESQDGGLDNATIFKLAKKSGYNVAQLKKAMAQKWVQDQIDASYKVGAAIGVNATPMFAIGNVKSGKYRFIPGAYPQTVIQSAIDAVK